MVLKETYQRADLRFSEGLLGDLELVQHHARSCRVQPRIRRRHHLAWLGRDVVVIRQVPLVTVVLQGAEAMPTYSAMGDEPGFRPGY